MEHVRVRIVSAFFIGIALLTVVFRAAAAPHTLTFPQKRGATYEEIRRHQALGRLVVSSDATFFLYEWSRPYDWAPNTSGLSPAVAARKQTFLYKVDTPDFWRVEKPPTSRKLFPPAPGATYYMGELSPHDEWLSFYEIDWDEKKVRAGVVRTRGKFPPEIVWLSARPDDKRLYQLPTWVSANEVVYPVEGGMNDMVQSNIVTGVARLCRKCSRSHMADSRTRAPEGEGSVPTDHRVVARSPDGKLSVYATNTAHKLSLSFEKNGRGLLLFDNDR